MNTFTNKVVVVTGGNSGMGLAAAQEFSRRGAKVVISGRDEKTLAAAGLIVKVMLVTEAEPGTSNQALEFARLTALLCKRQPK